MEPDLEEQKKTVLPFMQRAQEIQNAEPKVAYYCRLYAIDQALKFEKRAKEINGLVSAAIASLERDKPKLQLDKEQDRFYCEAFALRIFTNADRVDRAGRADANTARAFYASSYFLEILNQWGPLDSDLAGKQKYAAWRAAEVSKAAREGRPPVPPPVNQAAFEEQQRQEQEALAASFGLEGLNIAGANSLGGPNEASAPPAPDFPQAGPSGPLSSDGFSDVSIAPPPGPGPAPGGPTPLLPGQRYRPGSPVYYCEAAGAQVERGTVGQVALDPRHGFVYRVALRDRLVEAGDGQVAPAPSEGTTLGYLLGGGPGAVPAEVVMVNDGMGWPVTYMIKLLKDGSEVAAEGHELTFVPPEEINAAQHTPSAPPPHPTSSFAAPPPPMFTPTPPPVGHSSGTLAQAGAGGYPSIQSQQAPPTHQSFNTPAPPPQAPPQPPAYTQPPSSNPPAPRHTAPPPAPVQQSFVHPAPAAQHVGAYGGYSVVQPLPTSAAPPPTLPPGFKPSMQAMTEAQKHCKFAISSLNFEDVQSAVKYLHAALAALAPPAHR